MRTLLLNNLPAPYFTPLFARLAEKLEGRLTVCYSSDWNQTVGWEQVSDEGNQAIILDRRAPKLRRWFGSGVAAAVALLKLLKTEKPEFVICYGYTLLPQFVLLLWAIASRTPYALSGDANFYNDAHGYARAPASKAHGENPIPRKSGYSYLKRIGRTFWLRFVVGRAAALICVGTANRMFWQKYGARDEQLFHAGFAVNNFGVLRLGAALLSVRDISAELQSIIDERKAAPSRSTPRVIFLFVGRLVERKNVRLILQAARRLDAERLAIVIAGSGEQLAELKSLAEDQANVHFLGNVAPADLPAVYGLADVLVLPARDEPWGLVINEAMACGLAIIAHEHCGAAVDLVAEDNGFKLSGFTEEELATAMNKLIDDAGLLNSMKANSLRKIQAWTIENAANGIVEAIAASGHLRKI